MEKFHPERIDNIVNKVEKGLKPIDPAEFKSAIDRLNAPLPSKTLSGIDHVEFDAGDFQYEIETEQLTHEDPAWSHGTKNTKITKFVLKTNSGEVNLFSLIPMEAKLYYEPAHFQTGFVGNLGNEAQIFGNKATLTFVLILLHEIGHFVDYEAIRNTPASKMISSHNFAYEAEEIRKERDSSAFALFLFKSICKDSQKRKDAITFLKYEGLAGYYESMREKMKKEPQRNAGDADDLTYLFE